MEGSLPAGTNQEEENSNEPRQMEEDADDDNQLVTSIQNDVTSEEAEMADTNSRLSPPRRKFGVCDNRNFTKLQGRKGHSLFQHSEHVGESSKRKIRSLSESLSSAMDKLKDEKDQNDLNTNTGTPKSTKRLKPHSSLSSSTLLTAEDDDNRLESVEDSTGTDESSEEPDNQSEWARRQENRERNRKLSKAIRAKIASLPLPDQLKNFVDFFRD